MARRLSLTAYLAYARGRAPDIDLPPPDRPAGPVVWAHATDAADGRALVGLCTRLRQQRPEVQIILTGDTPVHPGMMHLPLPPEHPASCDRFVARLRPAVALWSGQALRPALLEAMARHCGRMFALNARDAAWTTPGPRWLPDCTLPVLSHFAMVHAVDEGALRRLRRLGLPGEHLRLSGPLLHAAPPLDAPEGDLEELRGQLAARPLWLAAHLRAAEADPVMRAHLRAVRLAHRLLLIAAPATEDDAPALLEAARAADLRVCRWDQGECPDETTQVLLAEGPELAGLWYRLAPLSFLGSSLVPGHGGADPFDAANLGSAVLYGPNVGRHLSSYSRLVEAGGARIVRDTESLAAAVSNLVAPDQAATMAHAGWEVVSRSALLTDGLLQDIGTALDLRAKGVL